MGAGRCRAAQVAPGGCGAASRWCAAGLWRMVQEAVVTELAVLGAGWFAPPDDKRVSAPVAAPASVSPKGAFGSSPRSCA